MTNSVGKKVDLQNILVSAHKVFEQRGEVNADHGADTGDCQKLEELA